MGERREIWVDAVKIIACVFVVMGHFFQSMVASGIVGSGALYTWFNQAIYAFHVPLFFICSGYLYQRNSRIDTFASWGKNVLRKLLVLGVPYVVFSFLTWLLKNVFSGSVNIQAGGLLDSLLIEPMSPYWYLYCLFLLFLIIPTFKNKKAAVIALALALAAQLLSWNCEIQIYACKVVLAYSFWFAAGMAMKVFSAERLFDKKGAIVIGFVSFAVFLILSIKNAGVWVDAKQFFAGAAACTGIVLVCGRLFHNRDGNKCIRFLSRYTMPVFLMHTLFAASLRAVLLKIGIDAAWLHIVAGTIGSFAGPVIAAEILDHFRWTAWILKPETLLRRKNM